LTNNISENSGNSGNSKISVSELAKDGLLTNNPVFIQALGLCPVLATTATAANGLGMGLSVLAILTLSNLLISLMRKFIAPQIRIVSYVIVIAGFVTVVEMLLKAYIPPLANSLGIFIPLIVVNCLILSRAELFASKNGALNSLLDGVFMGLGFAAALFLLAALREVIGSGTFGAGMFGSLDEFGNITGIMIIPQHYALGMLAKPAGAFISLGILAAAFKAIITVIGKKTKRVKTVKTVQQMKPEGTGEE